MKFCAVAVCNENLERKPSLKLTDKANSDSLDKFAQNTAARPAGRNITADTPQFKRRNQVRGHKPEALPRLVLDPKLSAQARTVRIFDNIVERASREMT